MPKISALTPGSTPLVGTELLPIVQAGVTRKSTTATAAQSAQLWNSSVTYFPGSRVLRSGVIYVALLTSTNIAPGGSGSFSTWKPLHIYEDRDIGIGPATDFSNFADAWAYIADAFIAADATVTFLIEDDTYVFATDTVDLTHPCASSIRILGNVSAPGGVVWTFAGPGSTFDTGSTANSAAIVVTGGVSPYLEGITVTNVNSPVTEGYCGLLAYGGATFNLGQGLVVEGFWGQLVAVDSTIQITGNQGPIQLTTGTFDVASYGIVALKGSAVVAPGAVFSTIANTSAVFADEGSVVSIDNADLSGVNATSIVYQLLNSTLIARNTTVGNATNLFNTYGLCNYDGAGSTYGTYTNFAVVNGQFVYNSRTVSGQTENFLNEAALTTFSFAARDTVSLGTVTAGATGVTTLTATQFALGSGTNHSRFESGTSTLVSGSVTVPATWATVNTRLFFQQNTPSGIPGVSWSRTITPATNFSINSLDVTGAIELGDNSTVDWFAVVPV